MENLEVTRRMTRRYLAVASFCMLSLVGTGMIGWGISSADAMENITSMTGPIGIVFGCWVATISGYFAASAYNKGNGNV